MSKLWNSISSSFTGEKFRVEEFSSDNESDQQHDDGAPVEHVNPLGYNLGYTTAFFMALQGVIGTGIFNSPATILNSMGSIGASYLLWVCGFIIAIFQILVNIEFVTYFQRRSGGSVVYLEQSYPKPKYLVASTYAAVTVILSFLTSSAIAFGNYVLAAADYNATAWESRGVGVGVLAFVAILTVVSSKFSLRLSNAIGIVKLIFTIFIAITGLVVLGGHTRVKNPTKVFKNSWEGTTTNGNNISGAILNVAFSYGGTQYLFNIAGEAPPKKTLTIFKFTLPLLMGTIFILYLLVITAFYAGIGDVEAIKKSGNKISAVFFQNVFGDERGVAALDAFVAISAFGHLLAVFLSSTRAVRECGRQGVLPYSSWWTTTKPFGTPLLPAIAIFIVNVIVLVAPPPGDAYNFVVDLGSYSTNIFSLLLVIGLFRVRKQRKDLGLGFNGVKVPLPILIITVLFLVFVIALAFVPPKNANGSLNGSDVSFFYATYALTTIGLLSLCVAYYYVWGRILPYFYKYEHRTVYYTLKNGETGHTVVKVANDELAEWDAHHDSNGREIDSDDSSVNVENTEILVELKK